MSYEPPFSFQIARVTYVNHAQDKRFGFVKSKDGESIFFHFTARKEPQFIGGDEPCMGTWQDDLQIAELTTGMDIAIGGIEKAQKGKRANWWCFAPVLLEVMGEIETRKTYRLMLHMGVSSAGRRLKQIGDTPATVQWQGKNLVDLSRQWSSRLYPVMDDRTYQRWFEVLEGDTWVRCDDPRR